MAEVYLSNFRNAVNAQEVAKQICSVVEANDIHAFAQFLSEPSVKALQDDQNYCKYYNLLCLFAYGTYKDAVERKDDLPDLNETMLRKIRQLSLVTMCTRSKIFLIEDAMRELQITDLQEFQRLFISAIYDGIIQGRLNAQRSEVEVFSWKNRDIADDELDDICQILHKWIQRCTDIKEDLSHVAKLTEKAIAEANERENKKAHGKLYNKIHHSAKCEMSLSTSCCLCATTHQLKFIKMLPKKQKKCRKCLRKKKNNECRRSFIGVQKLNAEKSTVRFQACVFLM